MSPTVALSRPTPVAPRETSSFWRVAGASARGARHADAGQDNQDAFHAWTEGDCFVIAVADGHGSPIHYRSAIGAAFAVNAAAAVLADWIAARDGADAHRIPTSILDHWRTAVRAYAADNPNLLDLVTARLGGGPMVPYGATLVAAAGDGRRTVVVQIGDGDALLGFGARRIVRPLPDDGLDGERTYSLCQSDALSRFRLHIAEETPDFVSVSTDGVSKSFACREAFTYGAASVEAGALPTWLAHKADGPSRDDATFCFARLAR
ncbi:hypothetical protein ABIB58_002733 [Brevundimonas sp. UYEF29]|uniref:PPM-type phosphatase domain-containing protein n=2 Tax=Alphaproteobacteria TaxID=28211 RepID=A0ABX0XNT7_9SPHN|nr:MULTISPECIES: protein phosphatase 2C domain-containing protein [Alphaproteobacteria]MCW0047096.1 protein phosphatase 2C domain-containing protein [Brevundimonas sp. BT-123]NJC34397.1 hypothetical protein [Sphingomonas jejuensis]